MVSCSRVFTCRPLLPALLDATPRAGEEDTGRQCKDGVHTRAAASVTAEVAVGHSAASTLRSSSLCTVRQVRKKHVLMQLWGALALPLSECMQASPTARSQSRAQHGVYASMLELELSHPRLGS
jgi:hypothetical protein